MRFVPNHHRWLADIGPARPFRSGGTWRSLALCASLLFCGFLETPAPAQTTNIYTILNCQTTYGATGNGATDDTQAIQRCINAVPPTGGEVFLPAGKYRITSTLQMGNRTASSESQSFVIHLKGAGVGSANTITTNASEWLGGTSLVWGGPSGETMLIIAGPLCI
jgi:hypothetical protein